MSNCLCGTGKNLGQPGCTGKIGRPQKGLLTRRLGNDGVENNLKLTDVLGSSFFTGLINQSDISKRLYPTGTIVNVVDERGDPVTYNADNIEYFSSQGNRTFTFEIIDGASPQLEKAYNNFRCQDMCMYLVSVDSQIVGNERNAGILRPFRVEKNTLYAKYIPATATTPERLMVTLTFSVLEKDGDISYFNYTEGGTGAGVLAVNPLDFQGLVDVTMGTATGISTTAFTIPMDYIYGGMGRLPFEAGILADFTLYNVTDASSVTITSVTETDGSYAFVIPTQTSADVLRLTFSKTGFECTNVLSITIP